MSYAPIYNELVEKATTKPLEYRYSELWEALLRAEKYILKMEALQTARPEVARIPAGWKLVPLVPTDEMEKAAAHEDNRYSNNRFTFASESRFFNVYCAMLRTAPEAPRALPLEEFEKHLRGEPSAVSPLARSQEKP